MKSHKIKIYSVIVIKSFLNQLGKRVTGYTIISIQKESSGVYYWLLSYFHCNLSLTDIYSEIARRS